MNGKFLFIICHIRLDDLLQHIFHFIIQLISKCMLGWNRRAIYIFLPYIIIVRDLIPKLNPHAIPAFFCHHILVDHAVHAAQILVDIPDITLRNSGYIEIACRLTIVDLFSYQLC